jgi:hypothetical protein
VSSESGRSILHGALRQRILYYAARMISKQIGESEQYARIEPAITMLITDFVLIQENARYHSRYRLPSRDRAKSFTARRSVGDDRCGNRFFQGRRPRLAGGRARQV